jgi:hypothetical protein
VNSAKSSIIAGIILIAVGVLMLLDLLGAAESFAYVPALEFAAVRVVFFSSSSAAGRTGGKQSTGTANWWALIPCGVMFTPAVFALPLALQGTPVAAVLFLGLAATSVCCPLSRSELPRTPAG